ncbi:MAG: signal recognition particle receptor subunit alpha, partial [Candidatus Altiarchaeota archaeon]|nr:signal recognition particle receptor subunit alpha [Candidatus Altiarchaeota archaeon]
MFDSLKKRISLFISGAQDKVQDSISTTTKLKVATFGKTRLSGSEVDDMVWQLQTDMLESDVSTETADRICDRLKDKLTNLEISAGESKDQIKEAIKSVLEDAMASDTGLDLLSTISSSAKPYKILFLGVNGTGKTTTMAKVAKLLLDSGFTVVFAAGDTFRAGAIEQLQLHARRLGVNVISHQRGADSAAVIYDAVE